MRVSDEVKDKVAAEIESWINEHPMTVEAMRMLGIGVEDLGDTGALAHLILRKSDGITYFHLQIVLSLHQKYGILCERYSREFEAAQK